MKSIGINYCTENPEENQVILTLLKQKYRIRETKNN